MTLVVAMPVSEAMAVAVVVVFPVWPLYPNLC